MATGSPQAEMDPSVFRAAKELELENTWVKPVPVGAPLPPKAAWPQAEMDPSGFSAAKAPTLLKIWVAPVPVGAPEPPQSLWPQTEIDPSALRAAKAFSFWNMPPRFWKLPAR